MFEAIEEFVSAPDQESPGIEVMRHGPGRREKGA